MEDKAILLDAIFLYHIERVEPEFNSFPAEIAFSFLKQQFDRDLDKYQNVIERNRKNISKRWDKSDTKNTTGKVGIAKDTKNTDKDYEKDYEKEKEKKIIRFTPPTLNEIESFISENKLSFVDPEAFFNYYQSNGWLVGKNKMKNWESAIKMWNTRNKSENPNYKHPANDLLGNDLVKDQIHKF